MALRELLARFGFDVDTAPLEKGGKSVNNFAENVASIGSKLAAGAVIGGLIAFTQSIVSAGDELDKAALKTGLSVQELQSWRFAADRSGASAEEFGSAVKLLSKNIADAAGGGAAGAEFTKLGVKIKDSSGNVRSVTDVITDMSTAIGSAKSEAEKTGIALKFFGKGGAALLPLLKEGPEGIKKLHARFTELGGGLSQEFTKSAAEANDAQTDLALAATSLKDKLGIHLLPAVTWVTSKLTDLVVGVQKATKDTNLMKVGLGVLGAAALVAALEFAPLLLEVLSIAIPLALLALAIEDIYTAFTGGHSAIGEFIDGMFGVGATSQVVDYLKQAWDHVVDAVKAVWQALQFLGTQTAVFLKDVFSGFKGYGTMFEEFFHFVWEDIKSGFDSVVAWIEGKIPGLKTVLDGLGSGLKLIFGESKPSLSVADQAAIAARRVQDAAPVDQSAYYHGGPPAAGPSVTQENKVDIHVNGAGDPGAVGRKAAGALNQGSQGMLLNALGAVARP